MKLLKSSILSLGIIIAYNSYSQQTMETTPESIAKDKTEKMKYELNLDEEQTKKVQHLYIGIYQKNQAINTSKNMSDDEKQKALNETERARINHLKTILTEEQYNKQMKIENRVKLEESK